MTQVNFYTLSQDNPDARLLFVCRLTEKARELGKSVFIHAGSPAEARQLDDLLWQFRPTSFIPHALVKDTLTAECAVHLSDLPPPAAFGDALINLSNNVCSTIEQFSHISEIVAADSASIAAGRERYRAYREAGATLETFKL